ncbi:SPFH domain-containing protein [Microbispora triticiradicis]|uniref:SPFH domain-containing protein n=3 Tax=Microbispora TaxID=2005 RepID=A0ABY3LX49_9ACTN|nr:MULTISPECIES: SPFH domain-containing protein [Microbispora]RGA04115.1 SPFH domain-containing protein [Microbispora triticiradicis]TLP66135.1 SPFH domain-containing protein [Microbispora fusca]TYB58459.1 SPFH domain-containing protein [Microbispora tritici]
MTDLQIAVDMPAPQTHERAARETGGWPMLILALLGLLSPFVLVPVGIGIAADGSGGPGAVLIIAGVLLLLVAVVAFTGLTAVAPGEARVIQLLGRYVGTVRTPGLRFVVPFTQKRRVSTRIRNHETDVSKVNDADGNPIEMAAVVVWQVEDTAKAVFEVDDFVEFVAFQTETAVRHIAGSYPYDGHDDVLSLRQNADEITGRLSAEIQARVASAGVRVIESRITRLAYAPEIAQAMLRRQQAGAVVAARQRIVEGAVGMVEAALARLDEHDVIELDEERKATMVSNLLVVLCGDRDVQPVVNTGSLYR